MSETPRPLAELRNGTAIPRTAVPSLPPEEFRRRVVESIQSGWRLVSYFGGQGSPENPDASVELVAVLADDFEGRLVVAATTLTGPQPRSPSITPDATQAHLFEREIAEQFGVRFDGHPWPKPVRFAEPFSRSLAKEARATPAPRVGITEFFRMEGEEIHEVAVGPVHAGVIEPGHFRFQCHGEHVFHLEISLGYQHRGVEEAARGGPTKLTLHQIETAAGDTTSGHAFAYCQNLEALAGVTPPPRAQALRGIALELERLANHSGDLGALAGDVGYLPTASFCGRLRGDFLNATAAICGNRFGRSLFVPGGMRFDLSATEAADLREGLATAGEELAAAIDLLWRSPSVMARFEGTGALRPDDCLDLGLVGVAARACGVERDVRQDHPTGIYQFAHIPVAVAHGGDVLSRAFVRSLEIKRSLEFIRERLGGLPEGGVGDRLGIDRLAPDRIAVSLVEGWRGEVCHVATTDARGRFARYKLTDPSFHNWLGLAIAMREQQISDFPLLNKSFNLSYSGHDL